MTEEELNQTGKFSDAYQDELAGCFGIMIIASMLIAAILTLLGA